MRLNLLGLFGERAGARTQDPVIKSHVLYRLSYALTSRVEHDLADARGRACRAG
jgi:hypothetical protein